MKWDVYATARCNTNASNQPRTKLSTLGNEIREIWNHVADFMLLLTNERSPTPLRRMRSNGCSQLPEKQLQRRCLAHSKATNPAMNWHESLRHIPLPAVMQNNLRYWTSQQQEKGVWVIVNKHLNKCYYFKGSTSCMNLLTFHIPPNNALLFMKQITNWMLVYLP